MLHDKVAVIVAGGKSSRMQQDKALLPFAGFASLAEFQYRRLSKLFSKVYISSKINKFDFDVEIIVDVSEQSSPLVALVSIFETLKVEEVFVLSVDAPFVSAGVIEKLYEVFNTDDDIVVVKSTEGIEPLCAIYQRSFLPKALEALRKNEHRLQSLFEKLKVQEVFVEDIESFMNLNYPEEYECAKKMVEH